MRLIRNGTISFGLISIPIKLYSVIEESTPDLDMLDRRVHAPINSIRVNKKTKEEVPHEKIAKGYR